MTRIAPYARLTNMPGFLRSGHIWPTMELCIKFFIPFVIAFLALLAVSLESGDGGIQFVS